jgi:hypothetical protein
VKRKSREKEREEKKGEGQLRSEALSWVWTVKVNDFRECVYAWMMNKGGEDGRRWDEMRWDDISWMRKDQMRRDLVDDGMEMCRDSDAKSITQSINPIAMVEFLPASLAPPLPRSKYSIAQHSRWLSTPLSPFSLLTPRLLLQLYVRNRHNIQWRRLIWFSELKFMPSDSLQERKKEWDCGWSISINTLLSLSGFVQSTGESSIYYGTTHGVVGDGGERLWVGEGERCVGSACIGRMGSDGGGGKNSSDIGRVKWQ